MALSRVRPSLPKPYLSTFPVRFWYACGMTTEDTFDAMTPAAFKAWENRMRRRLSVQGKGLVKSRVRLPMAHEYGRYMVVDLATNGALSGGFTLSPSDVERWASGNN